MQKIDRKSAIILITALIAVLSFVLYILASLIYFSFLDLLIFFVLTLCLTLFPLGVSGIDKLWVRLLLLTLFGIIPWTLLLYASQFEIYAGNYQNALLTPSPYYLVFNAITIFVPNNYFYEIVQNSKKFRDLRNLLIFLPLLLVTLIVSWTILDILISYKYI